MTTAGITAVIFFREGPVLGPLIEHMKDALVWMESHPDKIIWDISINDEDPGRSLILYVKDPG